VPIITLTTDFGVTDAYVGTMKGVILSVAPKAVLVDICHQVPAHDVHAASFLLHQAVPFFPPDTVHLAVVDPGVGSERRAVAVRTQLGTFVAPDNGLLSLALSLAGVEEAVSLTNTDYWLPGASATFHGRDVFAPVAAHLANGIPLSSLGSRVNDLVILPLPEPEFRSPDLTVAHVQYVDGFGNLILDITADQLPSKPVFEVAGLQVRGMHPTYAYGAPGQLIAYVGSTRRYVEIAMPCGHAAEVTGARVGTPVLIRCKVT
jgi:S-adenosylmethionine hydrolase